MSLRQVQRPAVLSFLLQHLSSTTNRKNSLVIYANRSIVTRSQSYIQFDMEEQSTTVSDKMASTCIRRMTWEDRNIWGQDAFTEGEEFILEDVVCRCICGLDWTVIRHWNMNFDSKYRSCLLPGVAKRAGLKVSQQKSW